MVVVGGIGSLGRVEPFERQYVVVGDMYNTRSRAPVIIIQNLKPQGPSLELSLKPDPGVNSILKSIGIRVIEGLRVATTSQKSTYACT